MATEPFDAAKYVKPGISLEEVNEIKEAFDLFDEDGGGTIDPQELKDSLEMLGFDSKKSTIG